MARYFGDRWPECWTHRPIPEDIKNVVLDANVLLDAALISEGAGWIALSLLASRGISFYTTERAKDEAFERLADFRRNLSPIDLILTNFLDANVKVLASGKDFASISQHDAHLAALADELAAVVLTEDLAFVYDANIAKIHARTVREILLSDLSFAQSSDAKFLFFFGTSFGADGHIFVKAIADEKVFAENREWNLFAIRGLGRLAFDSGTASFCFFDDQDLLLTKVDFDLRAGESFAAVLEYATGHRTVYTLKVSHGDDESTSVASVERTALKRPPASEVRWLNRYDKPEGWLGSIQVGTFGPFRLNRKTWRACRSLVGVAPSTLTADLSFSAAILCEVRGDMMRRPSWDNVRELTYFGSGGFYPGSRRSERDDKWFGDD
ncbi:PIN domain-containing protein [Rhizobium leguminosarum]|uniref:PIN domain-containing protein n=1 Tax=Rhizobium leguminosarum TaxID=384 RepID=UPI001C938DA6|nr:PIN domain-containing protein [Rhizobium leguminosarum]MBY5400777.1 PIN domain-containing protein [Rhizobium leguminosarum]